MTLTTKQQAFAAGVARGLNATEAARQAGYANSSPNALRVTAARLMQHPGVQQAAQRHRESRLNGPMAAKALDALERLIDDEGTPAAARVQAIRYVLESAGHGIENRRLLARFPMDGTRPVGEMTIQELEKVARGAMEELQDLQQDSRIIEAEIVEED